MTPLARFNPFRTPARYDTAVLFDDLLRNFGVAPLFNDADIQAPSVRLDVTEDEHAFHVRADVPGVDKQDIHVAVDGNQVSITAESKREVQQKGERDIITERAFGKAYRAFLLPTEVDSTKTEARYDKGVLTLTLPKKPNGSAQRIAVE